MNFHAPSFFRVFQAPKCCGHRFLRSLSYLMRQNSKKQDAFVFFSRRLNWLLRHGASELQLPIRPDGFVRIDDVRTCSKFRYISPLELDKFIEQQDELNQFKIIQDYDIREGADCMWIRSRRGHSIKSVDVTVKRILSTADLPVAVFPTDLSTWVYTEHHGIQPSLEDGFCRLFRTKANENFSHAAGSAFDVCIYLDVEKMLETRIQLFLTTRGEVLTTGDRSGVLPPTLFKEVHRIYFTKETILDNSAS